MHPAFAYESELSTLRLNTKKNRTTFVVRFAFGRDSVGIDESKNDEMFIKQID